jgi:hypothetical protein
VGAQEIITVRQCSGHAARLRLIRAAAEQRVEPDQAVTCAPESGHLAAQLIWVTTVPSVTDDDHDRAVSEHAPRMYPLKGVQGVGDARASADIVHLLGDVIECGIDVTVTQQMGNSCQMCRKRERLHALAPADGMGKHEQVP